MDVKRLISKISPRFYSAVALAKRELWDEYKQLPATAGGG